MDFDPVTKNIWIAGNEESHNVNNLIRGADLSNSNSKVTYVDRLSHVSTDGIDTNNPRIPKFTWNKNVGPIAISFVNSSRLGEKYQGDFFVGDIYNGSLYHFDLNKNRTDLLLNGSLSDKVVNSDKEIKSQTLLSGLGKIIDMQAGDDGYLYFSTIGISPQDEEKFPSSDGAVYRLKALGK